MGRIRTLKPEFFRSKGLARCSLAARLTFQGLWCEADDFGRGEAEPRVLAGAIWPLDDDIGWQDVEGHLAELEAAGKIRLYEVDGDQFYEIVSWEEHQSAAYRRGKAQFPAPPEQQPAAASCTPTEQEPHAQSCEIVQVARPVVLELGTGKGTGNGERGTGIAPRTARASDPIWDALIDCWQIDQAELTKAERSRINAAVKSLRDIGADPDEIPARRQMYAVLFPHAAQTMMALVNRWAECRPDPNRLPSKAPRNAGAIARAVARSGS